MSPIRKIQEKKQNQFPLFALKVAFIALVILLVIAMHFLLKNSNIKKNNSPPKNFLTKNILGVAVKNIKENLVKKTKKDVDFLQKQLETAVDFFSQQAEKIYEKHAPDVGKISQDIINRKTIDPIITQFQKLPPTQREYIKKQLCK